MNVKKIIENRLSEADIKINGSRPWDIQVHNDKFYNRVITQGTLGIGESYMDGWWDCEALDEMIFRALRADGYKNFSQTLSNVFHSLQSSIFNFQTRVRSKKVTEQHYDIGDDLYMAFLDPYNQYTCGYFKDTDDLNKAQENKMDLICRKLQLKPTDRVLDMGCGWGGLAKWIAEKYGSEVTGINLAKGQVEYAQKNISNPKVKIIQMDYRDMPEKLEGTFDKIVSVGMFEHVGYKNHRAFMKIVKKMLAPDGLMLIHGCSRDTSGTIVEPWINKYIFPGALAPSPTQITKAFEGLFVLEDWHNIGAHYDPTLMAWYKNFDASWPRFKDHYDERFYRMFRYYLLSCAGSFRARSMELWQTVYSHKGVVGGYQSVR